MPDSDSVVACALTAIQERKWEDTRAALIWNCPGFSHILYEMLNGHNSKHIAVFSTSIPVAATDGRRLILNPVPFFNYDLPERVFILAHEIMHCILQHLPMAHGFSRRGKVSYPSGKEIPYEHNTMNIATDLVINDALIASKIGKFNKDWLHDPKVATNQDSAVDTYAKVYKNKPKGSGFDQLMAPSSAPNAPPAPTPGQWQTAIASAANLNRLSRKAGDAPSAIDRMFDEILNPEVDWRDKIQGLFARKVGSGSYNWRSPDRRLIVRDIYAPGRSGNGAGCVVVACDTSGSIGPKEVDMFFAEMAGILEDVNPKRTVVMWCDAKVHRVDEAEDASDLNVIRHKGAPGGGGTDFRPVFDKVEEMGLEPDAVVYLTDLEGAFPSSEPRYPVIWGNINKGAKAPFGDVVDIPTDK